MQNLDKPGRISTVVSPPFIFETLHSTLPNSIPESLGLLVVSFRDDPESSREAVVGFIASFFAHGPLNWRICKQFACKT
jgi:hypothetical protein